jgi:uncharacterized membrane protein
MNDARNPYSPPTAAVEDPSPRLVEPGPLIENGRSVPTGNCTRWIGATYALFSQRPWKWIGTMLLLALISVLVSLLPLSNLLTTVLWPVVAGGIAYALDQQRQTQSFTLSAVFSGFGPRMLSLVAVGCVGLLSYGIMFVIMSTMVGNDTALAVMGGGQQLSAIPPGFWSAMLVTMALTIPLTAATFLAAPLIMLHGARPVDAMKMSFFGCMKNIVPWILSGVLMVLLICVSAIPLLLGLFVTLPMAVMLFYSMYRDIFLDDL